MKKFELWVSYFGDDFFVASFDSREKAQLYYKTHKEKFNCRGIILQDPFDNICCTVN